MPTSMTCKMVRTRGPAPYSHLGANRSTAYSATFLNFSTASLSSNPCYKNVLYGIFTVFSTSLTSSDPSESSSAGARASSSSSLPANLLSYPAPTTSTEHKRVFSSLERLNSPLQHRLSDPTIQVRECLAPRRKNYLKTDEEYGRGKS